MGGLKKMEKFFGGFWVWFGGVGDGWGRVGVVGVVFVVVEKLVLFVVLDLEEMEMFDLVRGFIGYVWRICEGNVEVLMLLLLYIFGLFCGWILILFMLLLNCFNLDWF